MEREVKEILKERGSIELFTKERYKTAKMLLKVAGKQAWDLFRIDPYYKAVWISDMIERNFKGKSNLGTN